MENFPNLAKEIDFQEVQKAQKLDPRRNTPRHIIIKLSKIIDNHSFIRFYLFTFRQMKGGRKRERNIIVWLSLMCSLLGTWPTTQACALTGNRTSDPLVCRLTLNPLSYTSQGTENLKSSKRKGDSYLQRSSHKTIC